MKLSSLIIFPALLALLSADGRAYTPVPPQSEAVEAAERRTAAEPDVVVSLCISSGSVVVQGSDRREVRARSSEAKRIELAGGGTSQPAKRIEVLVSNDAESELSSGDCSGTGDIELDVPRGATVNLQVHHGNIQVSDVAETRIESLNGDVDVQRVSKMVEVSCMSGDILLSDASGRARLRSVSGSVEATNVRMVEAGDDFSANSTSGDVTLERISHSQVKGVTISGRVSMTGPLAKRGNYELKSTSGDITLELPADASFKVNARVVASGEIITDFPVKANLAPANPPHAPPAPHVNAPPSPGPVPPHVKYPQQGRLTGTVGTGDADLTLTTFSGTVYLKKQ